MFKVMAALLEQMQSFQPDYFGLGNIHLDV